MTPQQIVGIAVRLFSLWLILLTIQTIAIAHNLSSQIEGKAVLALYGVPVLVFLVAILLWNFPMMVAHKLVPRTHDTNTLKIPAREATAAASAIIGLWVLIAALPQAVSIFLLMFLNNSREVYGMFFTSERMHQLLTTLLQVIFGLFLIIKPWYVASKIFRSIDGDASPPESPLE